jgi:hypothetical protein
MSASMFASPFSYLSNLITSPSKRAPVEVAGQSAALRETSSNVRKRKADDSENNERQVKRQATPSRDDNIPYDGDGSDSSPPAQPGLLPQDLNRSLMPPPATPHSRSRVLVPKQRRAQTPDSYAGAPDDESVSYVSTAFTRSRLDDIDKDVMDEARRYAAAATLPANSGIWSPAEQELFFHMAHRGFEALLPNSWMLDFETLPISIFVNENTTEPALIQNVRGNQFRASHALRKLLEAGNDVRDRSMLSPGSKRERILEDCVRRYLYWALSDVGLRPTSKKCRTPVHILSRRRKGISTLKTLEDVAKKLQRLSDQHQKSQNIRPSIETQVIDYQGTDETRVAEEDEDTPTLIGLVIISSLIVVVTLSPFVSSASASVDGQTGTEIGESGSTNQHGSVTDRLRIIAELDFSQRDQDVWNALGVAIVAMQIRHEALKLNSGKGDLSTMDWDDSMEMSRLDDSLDASTMSRLRLDEDDPDL